MPIHQDPVRAAQEARAEDDVSPAVQERLQEFRIVLRVVLQVRVLDHDEVARRLGEPPAHRRPLAAIAILEE